MIRIPTLALTALLLTTCAPGEPDSTNVLRLSDEPLVVSDVRNALRPTLEDTVGLHLIRDLELHGDTVIVADRNPRIVLLDRGSLGHLASIGREGNGPGELERPADLASWEGGFLVYDPANNRIGRYALDGTVRPSIPMTGTRLTNLAVNSEARIFATLNDSVHHLLAMDLDGGARMTAPRTSSLGARARIAGEEFSADWDLVAVTESDTIHVLDGKAAALSKYSPDGELLYSRRMPEPVRSRVLEGVGVFHEEYGLRVNMPFRDFEATPDGRLLIMFTSGAAGDTIGLVVDARSYEARVLRTDVERAAWTEGRAPTAMALEGDGLLVGWFTGAVVEFAVVEE